MLDNQFLQKILMAAIEEEKRRGEKISHIYIVGDMYFFDLQSVEGMEVDYTLVRNDQLSSASSPDSDDNTSSKQNHWDA